ncbi:unnamed protein product, partial [Prorocentrum cordatum]
MGLDWGRQGERAVVDWANSVCALCRVHNGRRHGRLTLQDISGAFDGFLREESPENAAASLARIASLARAFRSQGALAARAPPGAGVAVGCPVADWASQDREEGPRGGRAHIGAPRALRLLVRRSLAQLLR